MNNQNIKNTFKRIVAYMIDILIISIISMLIASMPILKKHYNKYQTIYDEFNELYTNYTNTIVNLTDYYKDEIISKEEYDKLIDNNKYKDIIEEKYSDESITKEELSALKESINSSYTEEAENYNYKLQKRSIYNSIITLSCTLIYFGIFQYIFHGQTLGKRIMKLKIISANGKKVNILMYILRSLIINNVFLNTINIAVLSFATRTTFNTVDNIISFLVSLVEALTIFLIITREDSRGLHDLICNTKVISTKEN